MKKIRRPNLKEEEKKKRNLFMELRVTETGIIPNTEQSEYLITQQMVRKLCQETRYQSCG